MNLVRGQDCLAQKDQAFKALTGLLSNKSDNKNYVDPLRSNELGLLKAFIGPKTLTRLEAPIGPFQALPRISKDLGAK